MRTIDHFRAAVKKLPAGPHRWTHVKLNPFDLHDMTRHWPKGLAADRLLGFQVETDREIPRGDVYVYSHDPQGFTIVTMPKDKA